MKTILSIVILFMAVVGLGAQDTAVSRHGNEILLSSRHGDVRLEFCSPGVFRVRRSRDTRFGENETWMVRQYTFAPVALHVMDEAGALVVETAELSIRIAKNPVLIAVKDKNGKTLYSEQPAERFTGDTVRNVVAMDAGEHFFGFGERMDFLDRRGKQVYLNVELGRGAKPAVGGKDVLRANYCPVPFMLSTRGYGIFFHTAFPSLWDMGWSDRHSYSFAASGGELDYYFIYGPDMYRLTDRYTDLTGKSPLLPRYAMGLHVGTYCGGTWKYEAETGDRYPVNLARRLRAEGIPFDVLWFDSTWRFFNTTFGNGGCTFEWRETFHNIDRMFEDLYAGHISAVGLHIRSILDNGPEYKLLDRAREAGNVLVPGAWSEGLVNFFRLCRRELVVGQCREKSSRCRCEVLQNRRWQCIFLQKKK